MKKGIAIIGVILILGCLLCGCSKEKEEWGYIRLIENNQEIKLYEEPIYHASRGTVTIKIWRAKYDEKGEFDGVEVSRVMVIPTSNIEYIVEYKNERR